MSTSDSTESGTNHDQQPDETKGLRSVDESREEVAGDQDDAAQTETDEDRTRGYV